MLKEDRGGTLDFFFCKLACVSAPFYHNVDFRTQQLLQYYVDVYLC